MEQLELMNDEKLEDNHPKVNLEEEVRLELMELMARAIITVHIKEREGRNDGVCESKDQG